MSHPSKRMDGMKRVVVTDAAEGPEWVRVTNEDRDTVLVMSDDPQGVAAAVQSLSGGYGEDSTK